ncbi:hypothetical protein A3715_25955 [Oleiphilus sp. HI0009]|nr:hypothetical protein A3715_25955 [Oleiphilus sp. HI0009]
MVSVEVPDADAVDIKDARIKSGIILNKIRSGTDNLCSARNKFYEIDFLNRPKNIDNIKALSGQVCFVLNPFEDVELLKSIVQKASCAIISHERGELIDTYTGGTIVSTNDLFLERMRNIRSSYGVNELVSVPITSNGRFSEAQALQGIMSCRERLNILDA